MLKLEYYNETIVPLSEVVFEQILDLINENFKELFPKEFDKRKTYYVSFTLVDDEIIQKLNKDHRGIDEPTDVISLGYLEADNFPGAQDTAGEIFISYETAKRQAVENHMDELDELKFLFVHGILHILGYEHQSEKDFQTMMNLTNEILAIKS
jgi:probable rRNA maturation factor